MNKLPTLTGALCTLAMLLATTALWAQLTPQVFIQSADPMNPEIVIEAENASSITDKTTGDTRNWVSVIDASASGGNALVASGGSTINTAVEAASILQDAKAYYYFVFQQTGDYYLYIRYKADDATENEVYFGSDFNTPIRSYLEGGTADGSYNWELVGDLSGAPQSDGKFPGTYSITMDDLNQVATLVFFPREEGFSFDKFVLSTDNTLTSAELDALTTETSMDYPDPPNNVLKYTAFEGVADELEVNTIASFNASVVDYPGHDNYDFPFLGDQMGVLDNQSSFNDPVLEFLPVDITCNYTDLNICFRWMAPQSLEAGFEGGLGSDQLQILVIYEGGSLAGGDGTPIGTISGTDLNTEGDAYNLTCFPLAPPPDATGVIVKIVLTADASNEDVFIGTTYLTVTNGTIPTAAMTVDATGDPMVTFDGGTSTDAEFYEWNFGDGDTDGPNMVATSSHEYLTNGTFTACLSVLDACENLPDVACQQVTISDVLPVELTHFAASAKGYDVLLNWTTATELNNDYFHLEHSTDGRDFKVITQIDGHGTTNEPQAYQYTHLFPGAGKHYYRLRQVDFDGRYEYSNVVNVTLEGISEIELFPNPVSGMLTVSGTGGESLFLDIYHLDGRMVQTLTTGGDEAIDISQLQAGTYVVKFRDLSGKILDYQRLVKL